MDSSFHARNLLDFIRETPVCRRPPKRALEPLRDDIAAVLSGVTFPRLSHTVATQLVSKVDIGALGSRPTWLAIGRQLVAESERLRAALGFVDRQIIVALSKMSPDTVEQLLQWLERREHDIARTILNAAISAADPREMAERYVTNFRLVQRTYADLDPEFARTVAHSTFMAADPLSKAEQHFRQRSDLVAKFGDRVTAVRTLAREGWRAENPHVAGRRFIEVHRAIVQRLVNNGAQPTVARSLAGIACVHADPVSKADELAANFDAALAVTSAMCPRVARSTALASCRSPDPVAAAKHYVEIYLRIVELVNRRAPRFARRVAGLAFRCDRPLLAARRYLRQCQ